ncbi:MAG: hypothetical protein LBP92_07840 [Deltaproteobacteria bacterium]|jgi:hypothetical protein|nr:hypothetical protein [Deltaproteobacteria bacterium]
MRPYITTIRLAIRDMLLGDDCLSKMFDGRIQVNRSESWGEVELPVAGVYLEKVVPIEGDYSPPRDERRATFTFEAVFLGRKDTDLEEKMDLADEQAKNRLVFGRYESIEGLDAQIVKAGGPAGLIIDIRWIESAIDYLPEASDMIGALATTFEIDYTQPWQEAVLEDFREAGTAWRAKGPDGVMVDAENIAEVE